MRQLEHSMHIVLKRLNVGIFLFVLPVLGPLPAMSAELSDQASCLQELGRRAVAACDRAIQKNPSDPSLAKRRAELSDIIRQADKDIAEITEQIKKEPSQSNYHSRGTSWLMKGQYDEAISDYTEAIKHADKPVADPLRPASDDVSDSIADDLEMRADAYMSKGDYDKAIQDYNLVIKKRPAAGYFYARSRAWMGRGDYSKAAGDLTEAINLEPSEPSARIYFLRGEAQDKQGSLKAALADFKRAAELDPGNRDYASAVVQTERRLRPPTDTGRQTAAALDDAHALQSKPPASVQPVPASPAPVARERRVALVIGNSKYKSVPFLPNPQRDAALVAETLKRIGFAEVILENDLSRAGLSTALQKFSRVANGADWAMVYFAGHGIETGGINYLIPVDAGLLVDRDVQFEAVPLHQVLNVVEGARKLRLVVLDACRVNPFANRMKREMASRAVSRGFVREEPNGGTLVVYAAKDGEIASDGNGINSPFTLAFVKNLQRPGIEIDRVFRLVRDDVMEATRGSQTPHTYGQLSGRDEFYFVTR